MFAEIAGKADKVLVLTEGVIPYLSPDDAGQLGDDLRAQKSFVGWITEYFAPGMVEFIRRRNGKAMEKAPFRFDPPHWEAFFAAHGWAPKHVRYLPGEAVKLGRPIPVPRIFNLFKLLPGGKQRFEKFKTSSGYALLEPR